MYTTYKNTLTYIRQIRREPMQGQASETNTLFKNIQETFVINCVKGSAQIK